MKLFKQIFTILLSFLLVFTVANTILLEYIPFILSFVIIFTVIFIIIKNRKLKKAQDKSKELFVGSNIEVFTITVGLLLMVFLTGGIQSALFFLLYFLLFGIAFLFEPVSVFIFALGLVAVFLIPMFQDDVFGNAIKVGSLLFLSPIAYFFSREFKRRETLEEAIEKKTDRIVEDVNKIAEQKGGIDELEDIVNKAEELQQEAKR